MTYPGQNHVDCLSIPFSCKYKLILNHENPRNSFPTIDKRLTSRISWIIPICCLKQQNNICFWKLATFQSSGTLTIMQGYNDHLSKPLQFPLLPQ